MDKYVKTVDDFSSKDVFNQDTDRYYVQWGHYDKVKDAGMLGKNIGQNINVKDVAISFGLFLAPKMELNQTINQIGTTVQNENYLGTL